MWMLSPPTGLAWLLQLCLNSCITSGQKKETYFENNIQSSVDRAWIFSFFSLRGKLCPLPCAEQLQSWTTTFYSTTFCRLETSRSSHAGGTNSNEFRSDRKSLIISGSPLLILQWKHRPPVAVEVSRIEVGFNLHLLSNHCCYSSRFVAHSWWRYYPQGQQKHSSLLKVLL